VGDHFVWNEFVLSIINFIDKYCKVTFVAWGKDAQEMVNDVDNNDVLKWHHPVAYTNNIFYKCPHFKILKDKYKIKWGEKIKKN
jgi:uracil DNA glycosylase